VGNALPDFGEIVMKGYEYRLCGCVVEWSNGLVLRSETCPWCMGVARVNIQCYVDRESSVSALDEDEGSSSSSVSPRGLL